MFEQDQFLHWRRRLNLTERAENLIQQIRSSNPARLVQSGRGNVSGRYPSRKMGVTIQFESHKNELAHIQELDGLEDVKCRSAEEIGATDQQPDAPTNRSRQPRRVGERNPRRDSVGTPRAADS